MRKMEGFCAMRQNSVFWCFQTVGLKGSEEGFQSFLRRITLKIKRIKKRGTPRKRSVPEESFEERLTSDLLGNNDSCNSQGSQSHDRKNGDGGDGGGGSGGAGCGGCGSSGGSGSCGGCRSCGCRGSSSGCRSFSTRQSSVALSEKMPRPSKMSICLPTPARCRLLSLRVVRCICSNRSSRFAFRSQTREPSRWILLSRICGLWMSSILA